MYVEIKRVCIVLTVIGVFGAGVFLVDAGMKKNKLERIQTSGVVIPMESLEKLEPARQCQQATSGKAEYRFVVLFDSSQCTSCALSHMAIWNGLIEKTSEAGVEMDYLFIFSPKEADVESFPALYRYSHFIHPVYLDAGGLMLRRNPFLRRMPSLHSLVIDGGGKVVFIGNPSKNPDDYRRFEAFLQERGRSPKSV